MLCICVLEASILTLCVIFLLDCGVIPIVQYTLFFIFWLSYRDDMQYAMHHNYVKNKTDYEIMLKQWWKKYHQYQQSGQSSLNSTHCMQTYHELWRGKSRSWPGKAQQCSWFSYNHDVLHSGLLLTRCYWNNTAYIEAITNDLVNNFGISVPQMTTY